MNPGQNYPIAEHPPTFWVLFLIGVILMVVALTGVFLVAVGRACQATRADTAAPEPERAPDVGRAPRRHGVIHPA
ncbi:hypothetical protein [Nocardioides sp. T2.26MG-1]|uniref:hypothetical protein n=1 Tax=Nocardioides sp. T2.26MG-1 TaxID=3041166 RepID=UPI0024774EEC|nr:hypothetical protein [Nocardioides sp. T2.26MG-1]CAI9415155.1 hypothetical protein HIDPHFAB_02451 [Nocardioides sp. T2.26MG-1]